MPVLRAHHRVAQGNCCGGGAMSAVDKARKARARQGEPHPVVVDHDGRCRDCGGAIQPYMKPKGDGTQVRRWRHVP